MDLNDEHNSGSETTEQTLPMGFSFVLPTEMSAEFRPLLKESFLTVGPESMPTQTRHRLSSEVLILQRELHESGSAMIPADVAEFGQLQTSTATLMERPLPYFLGVELVRGKLNQVRNQLAEWESAGLQRSATLDWDIRQATRTFAQGMMDPWQSDASFHLNRALTLSFQAADELIEEYTKQILALRHTRAAKLDTGWGCWLSSIPKAKEAELFQNTFNAVRLPLRWKDIEPSEANYNWKQLDEQVAWCLGKGLNVSVGPVVDFSPEFFPEWMETWNGDITALGSFVCDFVETTIARYRGKIQNWMLCSRSNCSTCLGISEEDQIRLTARMLDAAAQIDPDSKFHIGISHPWGSYLTKPGFNYSPFVFADTLLRAGLPITSYELEWQMGSRPRGDFCRDRLDCSKILDMFGMLGLPVQVTLSYPSASTPDEWASPGERVAMAGFWRSIDENGQALWAEAFAKLALSKPYVTGVFWDCWSDAVQHRIPHSGLLDASGTPKLALSKLEAIRKQHLK
ncbi:endo-1,4-beta-xylanase [Telmatocola sphagniphila]|uniref:Endo-1,4-beta-xylanase n=1 Tax=Telmatocola sphagniphila TaxID=1123043 RepID=A0A8E6B7V4_9BACT|nr:endo-1,4-beta-xylanase [Telmatocola sphagniphila]QVL33104.1 endo-1,4-beta-xylanase [Telmatocola sphagniphila]